MSKSSPNSKSEFVQEKRKLLYWIARWTSEETPCENISVDIPEMSVLFQSMGFRLEKFEKALDLENVPIIQNCLNMADKNVIRVDLTCPKSGMRSSLIKQTATCRCPAEEELDRGQFWCVTGCGPSSQNSINTSNSSLLPTVTAAKAKIIKALLSKVLMIINDTDITEEEDVPEPNKNASLLARHRSLDTLKSKEDSISASRGLKRRPSWEVDPKTSPPTQTSSPVPNPCSTLSRISPNSGQANTLVKNLEAIKKLVEEALEVTAGTNATFVKSDIPTKRVSDIKPVDENGCVKGVARLSISPKSAPSTPRKILTPKKYRGTMGERKGNMAPPSRIAMLRKNPLGATGVSPASVKSPRGDTPRPRTLLAKNVGGSCESILKSVSNVAARAGLSPRVTKATRAGTSGVAKLKGVGKQTSNVPQKKKT